MELYRPLPRGWPLTLVDGCTDTAYVVSVVTGRESWAHTYVVRAEKDDGTLGSHWLVSKAGSKRIPESLVRPNHDAAILALTADPWRCSPAKCGRPSLTLVRPCHQVGTVRMQDCKLLQQVIDALLEHTQAVSRGEAADDGVYPMLLAPCDYRDSTVA